MRAYVYTDASLGRYAGQFVWLSVNTEDRKNADFLAKYPIRVLPTLMVLSPAGDRVLLRYVGGATVGQLTRLLNDVKGGSSTASDTALAAADKLAAEEKHVEAAKQYETAIEKAPSGWKSIGRAAESLVFSYSSSGDVSRCAAAARRLYPRVKGTTAAANVASVGLGCALRLEASDTMRSETVKTLEIATRQTLENPRTDISDDDRSGLYMSLIDARDDLGDEPGARELRTEWLAFLERSASAAKTGEQRAVYDSHRLTAYLALGTPEKAIPMLEQSEREFPDDYNPPARLTSAYRALKQYDKALAANDRALAKVYGPRKITVYRARADVLNDMGDKEAARKTIREAIDYAKALPDAQRNERTIAALEKRLAELGG